MSHHQHATAEHDHHHGHGDHLDDDTLGELLDLDRPVLAASWREIDGLVAAAAPDPVRRVVDLGAGTGTSSVALARVFPEAEVVAVDSNPAMPARVAAKVATAGLGDRVRAVVADLDAGWPDLGPVDVVWASMALHHLGDPDRTLREVFAALRPDGLLVGVEFEQPVRVLAVGAHGDLEERAQQILRGVHERDVPELGSHWAGRFAAAGFAVAGDHEIAVDVRPPLAEGAVRYAALWLQRMAAGADRLDPADAAALRALAAHLDPAVVHLHGTRTLTLARRPL